MADLKLKVDQCTRMRNDEQKVHGSVHMARSLFRLNPTSDEFVSRTEIFIEDRSTLQKKAEKPDGNKTLLSPISY